MTGLVIAAPHSGAGKTTITLGLLRHWARLGYDIQSAKSGPDYIDPQFHSAASGQDCINLDAWAMAPERIRTLVQGPVLVEGAMGLFDGAPPNGAGSCADLAACLELPVILVVNAKSQSHSIAALVKGFAEYRKDTRIAGVILNQVGSPRHEMMLRNALDGINMPVFGSVPRLPDLAMPSRHLGLVQARENKDLESFLNRAADLVGASVDTDALIQLFSMIKRPKEQTPPPPPIGSRIAVAQDDAFAFSYAHMLDDWSKMGASLHPFSPLMDEAPDKDADIVFLPGGYPELHAGKLAANQVFLQAIRDAKSVYGECGGYMAMGEVLTDAQGQNHKMAGVLNLHTSFEKRKLHLGYRTLSPQGGPFLATQKGHEFHYASTIAAKGSPLFQVVDAEGNALPPMGLINGQFSGSFAHVIDADASA